jgi:hypothetical protein
MDNLTLKHYDCVEDIIAEVLKTLCQINIYNLDNVLESDEEFTCGTINIIKRGKDEKHLIHQYSDNTWHEAEITESYEYATYYKVSELKNILPKLSRKNYNNDFIEWR